MTQADSLEGVPLAVNNWGRVVSIERGSFTGAPKLFLWQNGRTINLGDLVAGGIRSPRNFVDINDGGQIVASSNSGTFMLTVSPTWGFYPDGI